MVNCSLSLLVLVNPTSIETLRDGPFANHDSPESLIGIFVEMIHCVGFDLLVLPAIAQERCHNGVSSLTEDLDLPMRSLDNDSHPLAIRVVLYYIEELKLVHLRLLVMIIFDYDLIVLVSFQKLYAVVLRSIYQSQLIWA